MRGVALLVCTGSLIAAERAERPYYARSQGMGIELGVETLLSGDFRFGSQRYDWDDSIRYVLAARSRIDLDGQLEPFGGIDFYWDDRSADAPAGQFDYNALGFSLVSALGIHLIPEPETKRFQIMLVPSLHGGIGWHSASVRNVSTGTIDVADEIDAYRLELGAGVGLRLSWSQRLVAELGVGARLWSAGTVVVYGTSSGGPTLLSESISFSGDETFARLVIGYWW